MHHAPRVEGYVAKVIYTWTEARGSLGATTKESEMQEPLLHLAPDKETNIGRAMASYSVK